MHAEQVLGVWRHAQHHQGNATVCADSARRSIFHATWARAIRSRGLSVRERVPCSWLGSSRAHIHASLHNWNGCEEAAICSLRCNSIWCLGILEGGWSVSLENRLSMANIFLGLSSIAYPAKLFVWKSDLMQANAAEPCNLDFLVREYNPYSAMNA